MNITVLGAGNAGTTIAADLSHKGHDVTLVKTSNSLHNEHHKKLFQTGTIKVNDLDCSYESTIRFTDEIEEAVTNAELIIVFIQTNYHRDIIERISPLLKSGQTILFEPGYLSTCYLLQKCKQNITIIEAESSTIDCRITAPGEVTVLYKNVLNPFGVYPKNKIAHAKEVLSQLNYPFCLTDNVVEAALHNPNLIVHTVGAIFSSPRIEYSNGDYWMYREVFTPHVWTVVEALDKEKMDVLEALGCKRLPYVEACKMRNSTDSNENALDSFFDYANNHSPSGPNVPDSRYITEDVEQGLVLLESLASVLNIKTPVCSALINIAGAALSVDFRKNGRTVEALGYNNIKTILEDSK